MSWRDFEDLVALCFELSLSGRQLLEKERQRIFGEADLTVAWLRERRRAWQAAGSPAGMDFALLDGAIEAVVQSKQRILERWPVGSDEEIAAAQAAANRGEGLDLDETFAQKSVQAEPAGAACRSPARGHRSAVSRFFTPAGR